MVGGIGWIVRAVCLVVNPCLRGKKQAGTCVEPTFRRLALFGSGRDCGRFSFLPIALTLGGVSSRGGAVIFGNGAVWVGAESTQHKHKQIHKKTESRMKGKHGVLADRLEKFF